MASTGRNARSNKDLPTDTSGTGWVRSINIDTGAQNEEASQEGLGEAQEPATGSRSGSARESRRERARSYFGATTQDRMGEHQAQRDRAAHMAEEAAEGRKSWRDREHLIFQRVQNREAREEYLGAVRGSTLFGPDDASPKDTAAGISMQHNVYIEMMMQACMRPLSAGVNIRSVAQVASMVTTLRMFSPHFKERFDDATIGRIKGWLGAGHRGRLEKMVKDGGEWGQYAAEALDQTAIITATETSESSERQPYSAESAALTMVGTLENAFWQMREPDADAEDVNARYWDLRRELWEQFESDGIDTDEVTNRAVQILGTRMDYEPELRLMLQVTAHGGVDKTEPELVTVTGLDEPKYVWNGRFVDQLGHGVHPQDVLQVRMPMDADEHQARLTDTMESSLRDVVVRGQLGEGFQTMTGYLVGWATRGQGTNVEGVPSTMAHKLRQTEMMLASMSVDGIEEETQREVYSRSFVGAMNGLATTHPGFGRYMQQTYGQDWLGVMREAVDNPAQFLQEERRRADERNTRFHAGEHTYESPQAQSPADDFQPA